MNWPLFLVAAWFVAAIGLAFALRYAVVPYPPYPWALAIRPGLLGVLVYIVGRSHPYRPHSDRSKTV